MQCSIWKSSLPCLSTSRVVALCGVLAWAGCGSGDPESGPGGIELSSKAVSVDLVSPPCAEPGSVSGYIEGNGFGAKNVTITVGGVEAQVLRATGRDASFVVPEGIPSGPIEVVVTNPGGRIATINWVTCGPSCVPTGPEVCDGIDNDCNQLVDDGIADLVSGSDVGECQPEIQRCVNGAFAVIQTLVGPGVEVCDGLDNDCNATPDEDVPDVVTGSDVGECQPQVETCINGAFVISQVEIGPSPEACDSLDNDCNGVVDDEPVCGPTCVPTGAEVCDGIDNDCNELIDDGVPDVLSGTDAGECQTQIESCIGGMFVVVQPGVGPAPEACDGLDNDCSGFVDDGVPDIVTGSDVGECQPQVETCANGAFVISQFEVGPSPESCDALDNDCDGTDDNGITDIVTGTDVGECQIEIQQCVGGAFTVVQAGVGPSPESCDGRDNDCNGADDDGVADLLSGTDIGECQVEIRSCVGGAYALVQAGVGPETELCDGIDNDCDGDSDEEPACSHGDGVLLRGPPDALAIEYVEGVRVRQAIPDGERAADKSGREWYLSRLHLALAEGVTVSEVNSMLEDHSARVVSSLVGDRWIVVGFPPVGSIAAVEQMVRDLEATGIVDAAIEQIMKVPHALPPNYGDSGPIIELRPHLAARAHAAWNATSAIGSILPTFVVYDTFGLGAPSADFFNITIPPGDFPQKGSPRTRDRHGYRILSLISAKHSPEGETSLPALATGMFPERLAGRVVDQIGAGLMSPAEEQDAILDILKDTPGKLILQTSMGDQCPKAAAPPENECTTEDFLADTTSWLGTSALKVSKRAARWIERVRKHQLESRVFHVTSGGNDGVDAELADAWNLAALGGQIEQLTWFGGVTMLDELNNTAVVEYRSPGANLPPFSAGCRSSGSNSGGDLSAIGELMLSISDDTGTTADSFVAGTSFAAPLVSGLAAWVWSISPGLEPKGVKSVIEDSAFAADGCGAPAIDAYNAVLSLDIPAGQSTGDISAANVRRAILDLDDSGAFDVSDLIEWGALGLACKAAPNSDYNYTRFDLNGDGLTFESDTTDFDLDLTPATDPQQMIEGQQRSFSEIETFAGGGVTDEDILCFYAYSDLYDVSSDTPGVDPDGNPIDACERRELLFGLCHNAPPCVTPATQNLSPQSAPAPVAAMALLTDGICEAPAAGRIVFQSNRDGNNEVYVIDPIPGSIPERLTNNPASDINPTWLPDGRIGFSSDRDGERDIWLMDALVTDPEVPPENLTDTNLSEESWPAWSPDGTEITFDLVNGLGREIYRMSADGSNRTNLSEDPDTDTISSWSPDGSQVVFVATRDGDFEIYVMDRDGSNQVNLTDNPALDSAPSWSPDGTRIAFWSNRDGNREVYVMNADGSDPVNLTQNAATDTSPAWSPDGTQIAFRSQRDGNSEIYVMDFVTDPDGSNPRGSNPQRLTNHTASDLNPRWAPPGSNQ